MFRNNFLLLNLLFEMKTSFFKLNKSENQVEVVPVNKVSGLFFMGNKVMKNCEANENKNLCFENLQSKLEQEIKSLYKEHKTDYDKDKRFLNLIENFFETGYSIIQEILDKFICYDIYSFSFENTSHDLKKFKEITICTVLLINCKKKGAFFAEDEKDTVNLAINDINHRILNFIKRRESQYATLKSLFFSVCIDSILDCMYILTLGNFSKGYIDIESLDLPVYSCCCENNLNKVTGCYDSLYKKIKDKKNNKKTGKREDRIDLTSECKGFSSYKSINPVFFHSQSDISHIKIYIKFIVHVHKERIKRNKIKEPCSKHTSSLNSGKSNKSSFFDAVIDKSFKNFLCSILTPIMPLHRKEKYDSKSIMSSKSKCSYENRFISSMDPNLQMSRSLDKISRKSSKRSKYLNSRDSSCDKKSFGSERALQRVISSESNSSNKSAYRCNCELCGENETFENDTFKEDYNDIIRGCFNGNIFEYANLIFHILFENSDDRSCFITKKTEGGDFRTYDLTPGKIRIQFSKLGEIIADSKLFSDIFIGFNDIYIENIISMHLLDNFKHEQVDKDEIGELFRQIKNTKLKEELISSYPHNSFTKNTDACTDISNNNYLKIIDDTCIGIICSVIINLRRLDSGCFGKKIIMFIPERKYKNNQTTSLSDFIKKFTNFNKVQISENDDNREAIQMVMNHLKCSLDKFYSILRIVCRDNLKYMKCIFFEMTINSYDEINTSDILEKYLKLKN